MKIKDLPQKELFKSGLLFGARVKTPFETYGYISSVDITTFFGKTTYKIMVQFKAMSDFLSSDAEFMNEQIGELTIIGHSNKDKFLSIRKLQVKQELKSKFT